MTLGTFVPSTGWRERLSVVTCSASTRVCALNVSQEIFRQQLATVECIHCRTAWALSMMMPEGSVPK